MSRTFYKLLTSLTRVSKNPVVKCDSNSKTDISKGVSSMAFGKNLSRFRKEKGLTQEDLVKKSGVAGV